MGTERASDGNLILDAFCRYIEADASTSASSHYSAKLSVVANGACQRLASDQSLRSLAALIHEKSEGLVLTPACFRVYLEKGGLGAKIEKVLSKVNLSHADSIAFWSAHIRKLILASTLPMEIQNEVANYVLAIEDESEAVPNFAVHSHVGSEPWNRHAPRAKGFDGVCNAVVESYAEIFSQDVIPLRKHHGFAHLQVSLIVSVRSSVGVTLTEIAKGK